MSRALFRARPAVALALAALLAAPLHAGLPEAQKALAARDYPRALAELEPLADGGDANAQFLLAGLYATGTGVTRDDAKAADLAAKSAQGGSAGGLFLLGQLHLQGRGVEKDDAKGVELVRRAAEAGRPDAQFAYARLVNEGRGGLAKDPRQAIGWLRRAANQGYAPAQAAVGSLYYRGEGLPADYVLAYMWLNLARAQGHSPASAKEAFEALEKRMTPDQVAEAQKRSREWRPAALPDPVGGARDPAPSAAGRTVTGSGFIVSTQGHVVTNDHVVANCKRIVLVPGNHEATLVSRDTRNDLALLRAANGSYTAIAPLRGGRGVRPGDEVVVVGYPLRQVLSSSAIVTTGNVSALGGLANDASKLQITAPIQQGNSGGPLLDRYGLVVGVVQSKLNALRFAAATGDIPQNVNFAINGATLASFLDAQGVEYKALNPGAAVLQASDIGEAASRYTVAIDCQR